MHWGGLKDFADGSLGSQTALMHQPYANDPSNRGVRLTAQETLQELATAADMASLQVIDLLDNFPACCLNAMTIHIPDKARTGHMLPISIALAHQRSQLLACEQQRKSSLLCHVTDEVLLAFSGAAV